MYDKYKHFFELYLRICKKMYNPENPYDNLEDCIKSCHRCEGKLLGMLDLLEATGEISSDTHEVESGNVARMFCSIAICNAYMTEGEVMVFAERRDDYADSVNGN